MRDGVADERGGIRHHALILGSVRKQVNERNAGDAVENLSQRLVDAPSLIQ
jgi:hypothetical protein